MEMRRYLGYREFRDRPPFARKAPLDISFYIIIIKIQGRSGGKKAIVCGRKFVLGMLRRIGDVGLIYVAERKPRFTMGNRLSFSLG
jgi:hypothetical protein